MNNKTVVIIMYFLIVSTAVHADITTDGSVGPKGRLSGPHFHIGQELGSLRGNNLFHSFGRFNLNSSESATFTGDSRIKNVISRVTGGAPSTIDGKIKSSIGKAAFYFINPAGIVFDEHAQVDVPGAFYASTAGELKFADGSKFSATNPQGNTLSMASPEAFGFLGKQTGTLAIKGADLVFKPGASVHLSAGKITMANADKKPKDNASITGEGMDLRLISVGNAKQDVVIKKLPSQFLPGDLSITNTTLDASGNGKGRIAVRAGNVEVIKSGINANNAGNLHMPENQGIDISVGNLIINDSDIRSNSSHVGNAGNVNVRVKKGLTLLSGGNISSFAFDKGNAGKVTVKSGKGIELLKGGFIITITNGKGDAGNVTVKAENILLDTQGSAKITRIGSDAIQDSDGNAGNVYIVAQKELAVMNGSDVTSLAAGKGKGKGGNVVVEAGKMVIDGKKSRFSTGIFVDTIFDSIGNAGSVNVSVQTELKLLNRGSISSNSFSRGNAGTINIKSGTIVIKGQDNANFMTGITSASAENSTGKPGSVNVTANKSISIYAGDINISSGEFSNNNETADAKLTINTPQLNLNNNSRISAEAFGVLPASPIEINTSRLRVDNNSSIKTATFQSDGGPIIINAKDWAHLTNSRITTSVGSNDAQLTNMGNGGDITINTDVLVLDTGFIQANTNATNASGGDINLNVKQLVASSGNLQSGGNTPLTFKPDSGINVVQAAAPDGINGNITNTSPQLNIVGALAGLNTPKLDLNRVGRDPCSSIAQQSTMKKLGKGGIPYFNKGQDGYTIDRLLPKQQNSPSQSNGSAHALPGSEDCRPKTSSHGQKI